MTDELLAIYHAEPVAAPWVDIGGEPSRLRRVRHRYEKMSLLRGRNPG